MIDPKEIKATKITPAGAKVLIKLPDGKMKWVWRDKYQKPKPSAMDEFLTR